LAQYSQLIAHNTLAKKRFISDIGKPICKGHPVQPGLGWRLAKMWTITNWHVLGHSVGL